MSSSSSRAVSMMIGTALCGPQALAHLEPVDLRQHDVEHDEVDLAPRRTAASASSPSRAWITRYPSRSSGNVRRRWTASSSSTSRMVEASGIRSRLSRSVRVRLPGPYYSDDVEPGRPRSPRRKPRRGTLQRPLEGRLVRSLLLVAVVPFALLVVHARAPDGASATRARTGVRRRGGDRARGRAGAATIRTAFPASRARCGAAQWFAEKLELYGIRDGARHVAARTSPARQSRAPERRRRRRGRGAEAIVVVANRDTTPARPGGEPQRHRHRGTDRAGAAVRRADDGWRADRRRSTRSSSSRRTVARSAASVPRGSPHGRGSRTASWRSSSLDALAGPDRAARDRRRPHPQSPAAALIGTADGTSARASRGPRRSVPALASAGRSRASRSATAIRRRFSATRVSALRVTTRSDADTGAVRRPARRLDPETIRSCRSRCAGARRLARRRRRRCRRRRGPPSSSETGSSGAGRSGCCSRRS